MKCLTRASVIVGFLLALSGCSGGTHAPSLGSSHGGQGGHGGADGGLLFGAGGGGDLFTSNGGTGPTIFVDGSACAEEVRKAELLPLDMYVLLDKSASMLEPTGSGPTKWAAISAALAAFVQDPGSTGLGVGIQYFPLLKPGVPATCTTHAQCGTSGPCFLSACDNQSTVFPCATNQDCGFGNCVPLGVCERYPTGGAIQYCSPVGGTCPVPYGNCIDIPDRPCVNGIDCTVVRYATPDVPIVTLPAGATQLVASIRATTPSGNTPTAPALEGAVTHARDWAVSHAGHTVVAVLATDGLPTECTPLDIGPVSAIAAAGLTGNPKIPTFVIGVFGPNDPDSPQNLQTIAQAGGTDHAFIVDTSGDVTTEFLKALDAIRGSSLLTCDLEVPTGSASAPLDFNYVNLALTDKNEHTTQLLNVSGAGTCSSRPGLGWYYDYADGGGDPTKITLCSDLCTAFRGATGARLSLQIGCQRSLR